MKFIDGTQVHVFAPADEKLHPPGPQENWQESFVLYWYDPKHQIAGNFRLGVEPNYKGGRSHFNIVVASPEGIYRRISDTPMRKQDMFGHGCQNGDDSLRYEFDGEKIHWTLKDDNVEAKFDVELTVPPLDVHRKAGLGTAEAIMSAHIDAACHVTGTMVIKGKTYTIDALGVRDHAWGTRDLKALRSYRWLIADMGKDHSFVGMTFLSADEKLARLGWVIRGSTVMLAESVRIRTIVGEDGAANLGGTLSMRLTTGEVFEATFEPMYPTIALINTFVHTTLYHDSYCRVTWGDTVGFGIFETANNICGGTIMPTVFHGCIGTNGWHHDARPLRGL
jgi:hypothetical protein